VICTYNSRTDARIAFPVWIRFTETNACLEGAVICSAKTKFRQPMYMTHRYTPRRQTASRWIWKQYSQIHDPCVIHYWSIGLELLQLVATPDVKSLVIREWLTDCDDVATCLRSPVVVIMIHQVVMLLCSLKAIYLLSKSFRRVRHTFNCQLYGREFLWASQHLRYDDSVPILCWK
jgi:hypothetical protein